MGQFLLLIGIQGAENSVSVQDSLKPEVLGVVTSATEKEKYCIYLLVCMKNAFWIYFEFFK